MKILDCTLRDGGYYTQWDFESELVTQYFARCQELPIDYLEVGYRSKPLKEYLGEFFYTPVKTLERIKQLTSKKVTVMLNEKDTRPEDVPELLTSCQGLVDMVRIAVDPENFERALKLATAVKKLGMDVAFNVMYMSRWKDEPGFLKQLKTIDGLIDYFYLVDSYGGVYPDDIKAVIEMVRTYTNTRLGFHGHNNLEMALTNSLVAASHGVDMVDATVTGMGRGAGNLKTELLLTALNSRNGLDVNFNSLGQLVDSFERLKTEHQWGTNLPYMLSGANSLPQKDVMEWVTKRFYSFNSIITALQNQRAGIKDNRQLESFNPTKRYQTAIVIGGGPNAAHHAEAVRRYIISKANVCLIHASSKNAGHYKDIVADQYFCLVGNEGHRLERVFQDLGSFSGVCVLPPFPRKMGTYIPSDVANQSFQLTKITFIEQLHDTHTALALQTSLDVQAKEVILVGYDGYNDHTISQLEKSLSDENEILFAAYEKATGNKLVSVTPTMYNGLVVKSVYSLMYE